jgi:hypothetical protein
LVDFSYNEIENSSSTKAVMNSYTKNIPVERTCFGKWLTTKSPSNNHQTSGQKTAASEHGKPFQTLRSQVSEMGLGSPNTYANSAHRSTALRLALEFASV